MNLIDRYSSHAVNAEGVRRMERIREGCRDLAFLIDALVPDSIEKEVAFTQLSFVMMGANSAIAQKFSDKEKTD